MKVRIAALAFPLILTGSVCLADTSSTTDTTSVANNNTKTVLLSNILQTIQDNGYVSVKEVSLENNIYKIDAFDVAGQEVDLEVNAETGEILNKTGNENGLTMQQAALAVEKAGYGKIKSIDSGDKFYSVDALDKNGGDIELEVSRSNGVVSED